MKQPLKSSRIGLILGLLWSLPVLPATAQGVTIILDVEAVMERAVQENYGIRLGGLAASRSLEDLKEFNSQFDTQIFAGVWQSDDELERTSIIFGDTETLEYQLGVQKHFSTGTDLRLAWREARNETNSTFVDINPSHESRLSLEARQSLLQNAFGLRDRGQRQILKTQIDRTRSELATQIEENLALVLREYWHFVATFEWTQLREKALKEARGLLDIQNRRRQFGIADEVDVLQTAVQVKIKEKDLITAQNLARDSHERLRIALAYGPETVLRPSAPAQLPTAAHNEPDEIAQALTSRRDLKQLKADAVANAIAIRIAKNARLPMIDLVATLSANGIDQNQTDAIGESLEAKGWAYHIGGEFQWPIENRRARADLNRAQIDRSEIVLELKRTEDRVVEQTGEATRQLNLQFELARRNAEINELEKKKYLAQTRKFRQGRSSSDLVTRFLDDALNAEFSMIQSFIEYERARVSLLRIQNQLLPSLDLDAESRKVFDP